LLLLFLSSSALSPPLCYSLLVILSFHLFPVLPFSFFPSVRPWTRVP
jgi:hypothetical protein